VPPKIRLWTGDCETLLSVVRQPYHFGPTALPLIQSESQAISALSVIRGDSGLWNGLELSRVFHPLGAISASCPYHSAGECFAQRGAWAATSRTRRYWLIPRPKLLWQCTAAFVPQAGGGIRRRRKMEWGPAQPAVRLMSILDLALRGIHSSRGLNKLSFRLLHRQPVKHSPSRPTSRSERWRSRSRESSMH
jgi:hypothetical protein